MMFDEDLSNFKSSSIVTKESDDLPIIPKALIDKLTNVTLECEGMRSDIREAIFRYNNNKNNTSVYTEYNTST